MLGKKKAAPSREPLAVIAADCHLTRHDTAWVNSRILGDARRSFHQLVDKALELKLPLILAGDVIDEKLSGPGPVELLSWAARKLKAAGLFCYFIQGQHEKAEPPWLSAIDRDVFCWFGAPSDHHGGVKYGPLKLFGGGRTVRVLGLDYQEPDRFLAELEAWEHSGQEADVLVMHQVWTNFMGKYAPQVVEMGRVAPYCKLLVTGDYHVAFNGSVETTAGSLRVYSPGSICLQSINEPADKSFGLLYSDLSIEEVPLSVRPAHLVQVELRDEESADASLREALSLCPKETAERDRPLLRFPVAAGADPLYKALARRLEGRAFCFAKALAAADAAEPIVIEKGAKTMQAALARRTDVSLEAKQVASALLEDRDGAVRLLEERVDRVLKGATP